MGIVKRGNTYEVQVYFKRKMVFSERGFTSEREAKRVFSEKLASFDPRRHTNRRRTFDDLLEKYISEILLVENRRNTIQRYMVDIRDRIKPFFCYRPINSLNNVLVSEFRSNLVKSGLAPKSVNICLGVLSTIFRHGEDWGWLERNQCKVKLVTMPAREYAWWDKREDINRFLATAAATPYYAAYRLALECGLRIGEIIGLSIRDVNLEKREINVHRQWVTAQNAFGPTKQNAGRLVGWSKDSDLAEVLKKRIAETTDEEILFSYQGKGHRVSASFIAWKFFAVLCERAKVPKIRFHDLRHTFASWYMISGGNIWDLKEILGHASIQMTEKYAHHKPDRDRAVSMAWQKSRKANARRIANLKVVNT